MHQCEPLHLAIGGGRSIHNCSKERPHAKPQASSQLSASSATAWTEADTPRIAQVNFMLAASGDYVSVGRRGVDPQCQIVWRNRRPMLGQKMPWRAEYHSGGTSSAQTRNPDKVAGPNVLVRGTSAALPPCAMRICDAAAGPDGDAGVRSLLTDPSSFDVWGAKWCHRLAEEGIAANERRAAMRLWRRSQCCSDRHRITGVNQ